MSPRRTLMVSAVALLAAIGLAWLGFLAAVVTAAGRDEAVALRRPVVAIIVLGAAQYDGRPSPVLRARLDHGIALWREGRAPRLIVTGGRRDGDRMSEAAVGRRYAVRHGVPDSAILLESEGRTTSESLRAAAALLHEIERQSAGRDGAARDGAAHDDPAVHLDADHAARAILVSDPFHMLRLGVLARRHGIAAVTSPTRTSPISASPRVAWEYMLRESVKVPLAYFLERSDE